MQIQVNTDKNIPGKEGLARQIEGILSKNLGRFSAQLTRVEVHLSDENGAKSGRKDKRCGRIVRDSVLNFRDRRTGIDIEYCRILRLRRLCPAQEEQQRDHQDKRSEPCCSHFYSHILSPDINRLYIFRIRREILSYFAVIYNLYYRCVFYFFI